MSDVALPVAPAKAPSMGTTGLSHLALLPVLRPRFASPFCVMDGA
jgi:hypothetical protein